LATAKLQNKPNFHLAKFGFSCLTLLKMPVIIEISAGKGQRSVSYCYIEGYEMRRVLMAIVVLCVGFCLTGCETMVNTEEQQFRKYSRMSDINRRLLVEDIDAILLLDRSTQLTPWHMRTE
jgi:hypothetical protein